MQLLDARGVSRTLKRAAGIAGLAAALLAAPSSSADPPLPVEYWYVEANEGSSSGGHVALRLGADVFHYQQHQKLLRLLRVDAPDFLHEYVLAGNRSLHALRLDVSADTAERLHERFETRRRAIARQLERLEALRADRALLEGGPLAVQGAGFFATSAPAPPPRRPDPALSALRQRIEARHGRDFLVRRLAALRSERARLRPYAQPPLAPREVESEPEWLDAWAGRRADLAAAETALELLRDAHPLRAGSLVAGGPALSDSERRAWCGLRAPLAQQLTRLAASPRPDWGGAFLVGAARLLALEASCRSGRARVLDVFAGAGLEDVAPPHPQALALLARDADLARERARERLAGAGWDPRRLSDLENAAGRAAELRRAARGARLRLADGRLLPRRPAPRADWTPARDPDRATALALARAREADGERALARLHAYHLTSHNCATEIFRTLEAALGGAAGSAARLGGYVDPDSGAAFVPFASAAAVRARYRIAGERSLPSLRALRVAEQAAREGRVVTALRELSPLSARSYTRASADSSFLFFSDGAPALRPLLGAANLAAGSGAAFAGLLRAPFDGGELLGRGLRGAFWSVPELFFFSVRKGSNEYVAPEWLALAQARLDPGPPH